MGPFPQRFLLAKYGVESGRKAMRSRTKKEGISRFLREKMPWWREAPTDIRSWFDGWDDKGALMQFTGDYAVPAPRAQVWDALNDPALLQVCIDGCEKLAWTGEGQLETVVVAKVGPLSARFGGSLWLSDVDPGRSYVLHGQGEGAGAGFVKARAQVILDDTDDGGCRLKYSCETNLGGILATIGNKLVKGMADRTADQFFERFIQRLVVAMAAARSLADSGATAADSSVDETVLQSHGQTARELIASIDALLDEIALSAGEETSQDTAAPPPKGSLPRPIIPLTNPSLPIIAGGFGVFAVILFLLFVAG
jgi:carbon monoxide dehydrogenase subunit G